LNDVTSFSVRGAFFELHWLVAYDALNEIDQRTFIIVARLAHFPFAFRPSSTGRRIASERDGKSAFFRRHSSIAATSSADIITGIRWSFMHSISTAMAHPAQVG